MRSNNYLVTASGFIVLAVVVAHDYVTGGLSLTFAALLLVTLMLGVVGFVRKYFRGDRGRGM